jgi:hypothetical protein
VSAFDHLTLEEKQALEREFEDKSTTRERRIELLTLLQEGANEAKMGRPCPRCKNYLFYAPHDEALIEGHVYSRDGLAEIRITGYCEWCFDLITQEHDEEENDSE